MVTQSHTMHIHFAYSDGTFHNNLGNNNQETDYDSEDGVGTCSFWVVLIATLYFLYVFLWIGIFCYAPFMMKKNP